MESFRHKTQLHYTFAVAHPRISVMLFIIPLFSPDIEPYPYNLRARMLVLYSTQSSLLDAVVLAHTRVRRGELPAGQHHLRRTAERLHRLGVPRTATEGVVKLRGTSDQGLLSCPLPFISVPLLQ